MEKKQFGSITLVEGGNKGRYPFAHTLFIEDNGMRVVVDPAAGRAELEQIASSGGADIIFNTHYHEDHVTYNYLFPDAEIWANELDEKGFESIEAQLDMSVGRFLTEDLRKTYIDFYTDQFNFKGWQLSRKLNEGEELHFGKTVAIVVHLPGHTPGHSGLFFPDEKLLFCADVDLTPFGPWYGDFASSIDNTINSIIRVKEYDADWFISSHEGPLYSRDQIHARADMYLKTIYDREKRILDKVSSPRTLDELATEWIIYGKPLEPQNVWIVGEKSMIEKHLVRMLENGKVKKDGEKYSAV